MERKFNDILKEEVYIETLDNGLKIFIMPKKNYNRQYAAFATNYGSIDNHFFLAENNKKKQVPDGIAHFLEHKLFASKEGDVFNIFAELGAAVNAYTKFTSTTYLFSSTSNFRKSLINLIDFVQDPYFTDESVEKEKGIIAQEIKMYEDNPHWVLFDNLLNGLYHQHPVRINIAGTIESINKIKKEDLYFCYQNFYHPANMLLFLIGDFNIKDILNIIHKNQKTKDFLKQKNIKRIIPTEANTVNKREIKKVMDVSRPLFYLGFKDIEVINNTKQLIKTKIANNMLLDIILGKGSKLYQSLYEEGLLDDNFSYNYTRQLSYAYLVLGGETKEPEKLYQRLITEINQKKNNINTKEFNRIYQKYIGDYVETFNSFSSIAAEFIDYYFLGADFFSLLDIMDEINLDYLQTQAEKIFQENLTVKSIITPKKDT